MMDKAKKKADQLEVPKTLQQYYGVKIMFNFEKAFKLTKPFFKAVAPNALKKHKAQIFDDGLNQDGKPFAEYSTSYKAFRRRKGKTTKPNLTLSGKLKNSFRHVKAFDDGFEYGINNPEMAERYEYQNINKKRRKDGKFARRFVYKKTANDPRSTGDDYGANSKAVSATDSKEGTK